MKQRETCVTRQPCNTTYMIHLWITLRVTFPAGRIKIPVEEASNPQYAVVITMKHILSNVFEDADPYIVQLRIPHGDRPSLDDVDTHCTVIAGLCRLRDLMTTCWGDKPSKRPSARSKRMTSHLTQSSFKMWCDKLADPHADPSCL